MQLIQPCVIECMVTLILTSESAQTEDNTLFDEQGEGKGRIQIRKGVEGDGRKRGEDFKQC